MLPSKENVDENNPPTRFCKDKFSNKLFNENSVKNGLVTPHDMAAERTIVLSLST